MGPCLLLSNFLQCHLVACDVTHPPNSPKGKFSTDYQSVMGAGRWTVAGLQWLPVPLEIMASLQTACCGTHLHYYLIGNELKLGKIPVTFTIWRCLSKV